MSVTKATLSPSDLAEFLYTFLPMKRAIIVHSSPGLGKSQIMRQVARRLHGDQGVFADVRSGQIDGTLIRGLPDMVGGKNGELRQARFAPLSIWPTKGPGIVFLDELDKAEPETQNALLEALLDRRIGEWTAPDDVFFCGAANRLVDRAGGNRLNNALKSRCVHLHLVPSLEDWLAWAAGADVHPLITAYVELKGAPTLYAFDPTDTEADSFPCPRTWEMLSDGLKRCHDERLMFPLVSGTIGANAIAGDFQAFARWYYKLPAKSEVIGNPEGFRVPEEGSLRWALGIALVDWSKGADARTLDAIITAMLRLTNELITFGMVHLIARNPHAFKLPRVMKWAAQNQALLNRRRVKAQ